MIPAIAVMVGMYIVTRCTELLSREQERSGGLGSGPALLAIVTIVTAAGCMAWVVRLSMMADAALADLPPFR